MANAEATPGAIGNHEKTIRSRPKLLIFLVGLIVLAVAGYWVWHYYYSKKVTPPKAASASQVEKTGSTSINKFLDNGETEAYQVAQSNLALQYLDSKDVSNADRIMSDVFSKVQNDKLIDNSYYVMVEVQKQKPDVSQEKHFLELLIAKLKAENKLSAADQEQTVLDGLK